MRGALVSGEQLRAARLHRGLTQEELAERADLDVKTVRKAEGGKRIDLATLGRLAEALGMEPGQLIRPVAADREFQDRRRERVRRWIRAWDERDEDAMRSLYRDDATLHLPGGPTIPFGGAPRGHEEILRSIRLAWGTCQTAPSREGDYSLLVGGDAVILQGVLGIHLPDGTITRMWCTQVFTFDGDLIIEHRADYDTLRFVHLLEFPAPGAGSGDPGSSR